ncbi:MAG: hypothetical protein ACFFKA_18970, partial [Candidatus Thorarchaeota archaeon]
MTNLFLQIFVLICFIGVVIVLFFEEQEATSEDTGTPQQENRPRYDSIKWYLDATECVFRIRKPGIFAAELA